MAVIIAAVLMVFTGCLRNVEDAYRTNKLGKHRTDCRHDAYVVGFGENRGFVRNIYGSCFGTRRVWSISIVGRNLFYDIIDDNVYQQYSYGGAFGSHLAMQSAVSLGVSPYPYLFAVTVAASMCFASPFSTPPNALVMSAGKYTFMVMSRWDCRYSLLSVSS